MSAIRVPARNIVLQEFATERENRSSQSHQDHAPQPGGTPQSLNGKESEWDVEQNIGHDVAATVGITVGSSQRVERAGGIRPSVEGKRV